MSRKGGNAWERSGSAV